MLGKAFEWVKTNLGIVFLVLLAASIMVSRLGWFQSAPPDDPTAPLRHFTAATWQAEVLQSSKPVLVDFWATWCPPCRAQGPIVSELSKAVSGTALVGKVDVDKEGELAGRYGISGIPALLIFSKGQVVRSFVGLTSEDTLRQALFDAGAARP
jgi:thioredoxin 1